MKYFIVFAITFFTSTSCATTPKEPKIQHAERTYRTCTKKEVENPDGKACYRHCWKSWFRTKCHLIVKDIDGEFEDFILIHRSRLKR